MATVTKRGDLQWQCKVRAKGHPIQTRTFTTRAQAQAWGRVIESEMARGVFIDRSKAESTTLTEALDRYAREVSAHKKTANKEASIIRSWQARQMAARSLASIKPSDLSKYRDGRLKEVGAATVRNELALLSHLFTVAVKDWDMGVQNPVLSIRKPSPVKSRDRRLSNDEIGKIIEATESAELPVILRLLTETAIRRGELTKLRWEDVDLKSCVTRLRDTKNGEDRDVPLSTRAIAVLRALPRRIDGKVFGLSADGITRAFARACRRAGIEDARIHDLRHEAVSRLFEKGLNPMEVASVSGHKTLAMLKRYTHLRAEDLAKKLG